MIFQELYKTIEEVKNNLKIIDNVDERQKEMEKLHLLEEIRNYFFSVVNDDEHIKDYNIFIKKKAAKEKVKYVMLSLERTGRCNYKEIADQLNLDKESLKNTIYYISNETKNVIGQDTLSLIKDGYIETARFQFYQGLGINDVYKEFPDGVLDLLPDINKNIRIDTNDCMNELKLVKALTKQSITKLIKKVDEEKLSHLLFVIFNDDDLYKHEQKILIDCLTNQKSIKEATDELEELRSSSFKDI